MTSKYFHDRSLFERNLIDDSYRVHQVAVPDTSGDSNLFHKEPWKKHHQDRHHVEQVQGEYMVDEDDSPID